MANNIHIKNFKSVVELGFEAKRINLFIGEPNAGKSNILEALSLFSSGHLRGLESIIRFKKLIDLFNDNNIYEPIEVTADIDKVVLRYDPFLRFMQLTFAGMDYNFLLDPKGYIREESDNQWIKLHQEQKLIYKPYRFQTLTSFSDPEERSLTIPHGDNLPKILKINPRVRELAASIFKEKGYKLNLNMDEQEINMLKEVNDVVYTYPYRSISDTLQRIVFYLAAIESNKDSVLIFEEPEANTFPYYTKFLAERIALDENRNQYFIATHNPYLLLSLVEKTPIQDMAVNVVYLKDHQTHLKQLSADELSTVLDLESDVFFNLDKFIAE